MLIKTINLMSAFLIAAIVVFVLMAGSEARVTGNCVNCHTMHNSQGGAAVNTNVAAGAAAEFLLNKGGGTVTTCWGCHAQDASGVQNIIPLGNVPQVLLSTSATPLAGGNFNYIATVDNQGHNVIDYTANPETTLTGTPPGDQNSNTVTGLTLTCAGTLGCHGNRATAGVALSMKGAHHTIDTALKFGGPISEAGQGSTVGLSYRFLLGVKGGEETNWMGVSPSATVHNEYKGAISKGIESTISAPGGNTISGLCAECHGTFHGPTAGHITSVTASPWLRHPTDIILPGGTTEYAAYTAYNIIAPVARQTIPSAISSTVTPGTDVIMCLSCHRAHASPNFKMTRWDYKSATLATALTGCNVCHTSKN